MTPIAPGTDLATVTPETPTKTVSVLPYAYWGMPERVDYAKMLAGARGMIPAGLQGNTPEETAARVFLVLETGAMLGIHPMAALQGIDVIKGTAALSPQLFTGLARGAGMKLRIKEVGTIEGGDFAVEVILIRPDDDEPIQARFSLQDALRADLISKYEPERAGGPYVVKSGSDNWRKYPQDMCQWRALGRLARRGAADVTSGIGYFPEELEVLVTEEGVRQDMAELENPLIAEFDGLDDKADLAVIWEREHPFGADQHRHATDAWTSRVDAAFAGALAKATKDSRPPVQGSPGHTGDPDLDGPQRPEDVDPTDYDDAHLDRSTGRVVSKEADRERAARAADQNPADAPVPEAVAEFVAEPEATGSTIATAEGVVIAEQRHVDGTRKHYGHTAEDHLPRPDEEPSAGARRLQALDDEDDLGAAAAAADEAEARRWAAEHPDQAVRGSKQPPAAGGLDMSALEK